MTDNSIPLSAPDMANRIFECSPANRSIRSGRPLMSQCWKTLLSHLIPPAPTSNCLPFVLTRFAAAERRAYASASLGWSNCPAMPMLRVRKISCTPTRQSDPRIQSTAYRHPAHLRLLWIVSICLPGSLAQYHLLPLAFLSYRLPS